MPDELNPAGIAQNVRVLDFGHTEEAEEAFIDETLDWSQAEPQFDPTETESAELLEFLSRPTTPAPIAGATFEMAEPFIHLVANLSLGVLDVALSIPEARAIVDAITGELEQYVD